VPRVFHLLYKERNEGLGVDDGLRFLIEISLVGRTSALGHEYEMVFIAFGGVDVDLSGKVASGVHLVVHGERCVLRVAQIVCGIGVVYALGDAFLVIAAGEYVLALLCVNDGCTGILAERELPFSGYFGVAEHGESHEFVVGGCLRVGKNLGEHLVVFAAQHECVVVGGLTGEYGQSFRVYDKEFMTAPVFGMDVFGGQMIVFRGVRTERKHFLVVKRFCCHIFEYQLFLSDVQILRKISRKALSSSLKC